MNFLFLKSTFLDFLYFVHVLLSRKISFTFNLAYDIIMSILKGEVISMTLHTISDVEEYIKDVLGIPYVNLEGFHLEVCIEIVSVLEEIFLNNHY